MVKYQKYEEYKNSGVDWLGEIPKDWKAIKVKYIADTVSTGGTPKDLSSFTLEPEVCWFTPGDFHDGQILRQANKYVTWKSVNTNDAKIYKENSVLVIGIGATLGKVAHCSIPFSCNQQINVITPNNNISSFFLMYSLLVQNEQMSLSSNASTIGIMNQEKTKDILLALPSLKEQKTVTNFLDHETAQIDTLIEKQQILIQLLKEKRQAVISHAVTKGLNPDAPMKESGVEWLGGVPEHWEVMKGAFIGQLFGSESVPESQVVKEGTLPFIKVSTLSRNGFELQEPEWFVSARVANNYKTRTGYVVFPKRGAAIFTNKVNVVSEPSLIDPNLMGWQIHDKALSKYIALLLKTRKLDDIADVSTVPQINNKHINPEKFPLPPVKEQQEILDFIDERLMTFNGLIEKAEQAIQLMQERRTALISAAVTGKIDVRGWVEHDGLN